MSFVLTLKMFVFERHGRGSERVCLCLCFMCKRFVCVSVSECEYLDLEIV